MVFKRKIKKNKEIANWVRKLVSDIASIPEESVFFDIPISAMGIRSNKIIEFTNCLSSKFNKNIKPTLVFECQTLDLIISYCLAEESGSMPALERKVPIEVDDDMIAIVGMSCRFPSANSLEEYWEIILRGEDAISDIPSDRWSPKDWANKNSNTPSSVLMDKAGIVSDIEAFDQVLFKMSSDEVLAMDPQQRLLLKVAWEAIEDYGCSPLSLSGQNVGVFIGIHNSDHGREQFKDLEKISHYLPTGSALSVAAGRISYQFNLVGPVMSVDTACSSALSSVYLASNSLLLRESKLALVGGVNAVLSPDFCLGLSKARMLSKTNKCHTFSAEADGYVRSDGCGILVLKRWKDAVEDGDRVYSVIRGTSINHDGSSNGLAAPNKSAQVSVIRSALEKAKIEENDVDYIEAHGTGTRLGDLIELEAIEEAVGCRKKSPLYVGSVKTNIGHSETASGAASLIKAALLMYHRVIPRSINFNKPNPLFDWKNSSICVPQKNYVYKPSDLKPIIVGVSAFGYSGTNVHLIAQSVPHQKRKDFDTSLGAYFVIAGAETKYSILSTLQGYLNVLKNDSVSLRDFCFSQNSISSPLKYRTSFVCGSKEELVKKISLSLNKQNWSQVSNVYQGSSLAFIFPGQGEVFVGMAKDLYRDSPVFRDALHSCDSWLLEDPNYDGPPVSGVVCGDDSLRERLAKTSFSQPLMYSLQYALSSMLSDFGIYPNIVLGHSLGEYAAAASAGCFSWKNGLSLVVLRSSIMEKVPHDGAMISIFATLEKVRNYLRESGCDLEMAAINAADNVVVSGYRKDVVAIQEWLKEKGVLYKVLQAPNAYHSSLMDEVLPEYKQHIEEAEFDNLSCPMALNTTGNVVYEGCLIDKQYWLDQIRRPVRFHDCVNSILKEGVDLVIEIGPTGILSRLVRQKESIPLLTVRDRGLEGIFKVFSFLYEKGENVNANTLNRFFHGNRISCPHYPFDESKKKEVVSDSDSVLESPKIFIPNYISQLLGIDREEFSATDPMSSYGFDSLMAIQVMNQISKVFQVELSISSIMSVSTALNLTSLVLEKMQSLGNASITKKKKRGSIFPLRDTQKQMYALQSFDFNTPAYLLPVSFSFSGPLDIPKLKSALEYVCRSHSSLRSAIYEKEQRVVQEVLLKTPEIKNINFSNHPIDISRQLSRKVALEISRVPFLFDKDNSLNRIVLVQLSEEECHLYWIFHHIIMDGWSLFNIVLPDLLGCYANLLGGKGYPRDLLSSEYYCLTSNNHKYELKKEKSLSYWKNELRGSLFNTEINTDYDRPEFRSYKGRRLTYQVDPKVFCSLNTIAKESGVTLYVVLLSSFLCTLSKWSNRSDLVIGITLSGRYDSSLEDVVGDFTNHLPFRKEIDEEVILQNFFKNVSEKVMSAIDNSYCTSENVIDSLRPDRFGNRNPLYSISFLMHAFNQSAFSILKNENIEVSFLDPIAQVDNKTSEMDIIIEAIQVDSGVIIQCEFDTDIYAQETIDIFMECYLNFLSKVESMVRNKISDIPLIGREDSIFDKMPSPFVTKDEFENLGDAFDKCVDKFQNKKAIKFREHCLTYKQLSYAVNRMVRSLSLENVNINDNVGIYIRRGILQVVCIFSLLKLGVSYVILDVKFPKNRLLRIEANSRMKNILVDSAFMEESSDIFSSKIIPMDFSIEKESNTYKSIFSGNTNAYILYTSGSTGDPKGVKISHKNVLDLFESTDYLFSFNSEDVWVLFHSLSFDFSVWELWGSFLHGAMLVIADENETMSAESLQELIVDKKVTVLNQTPSSFKRLISVISQKKEPSNLSCLRYIILGGELLPAHTVSEWYSSSLIGDHPKLVNMYGITETTVHVTAKEINSKEDYPSSIIGRPIPGKEVKIVDANGFECAVGAIGEMCIGGHGVSSGYFRQDDLTNNKFINGWFRSGDLGRITHTGEIQYISRMDDQVKIRGFRIEIGEIEQAIKSHEGVADCVAKKISVNREDDRIIAYCTMKDSYFLENNFEESHVSCWEEIFDSTYHSTSGIDPTFHYIGWNSSYTRDIFSKEEMSEWVSQTVKRIADLHPKHLLELGCGTGMILFKLIPICSSYTATDLSGGAISYIEENINGIFTECDVNLFHQEAIDFSGIEENEYDTIVINSVCQMFPSLDYLDSVFEKMVINSADGARIFLGDILNNDLLNSFHESMALFNSSSNESLLRVHSLSRWTLCREKDLHVSPSYFYGLKKRYKRIKHVSIDLKNLSSLNEMSKYRYDVTIYLDSVLTIPENSIEKLYIEDEKDVLSGICKYAENRKGDVFAIKNIKNLMLKEDMFFFEKSVDFSFKTVADFKREVAQEYNGVMPESIYKYCQDRGYGCSISYSKNEFYFDCYINTGESTRPLVEANCLREKKRLSNNPARSISFLSFDSNITRYLSGILPDYMIPWKTILVNDIPLTLNGKVDFSLLPIPLEKNKKNPIQKAPLENPVETILMEIVEKVLKDEDVSILDNFFRVGGNSILATTFLIEVNKKFSTELTLRDIFKSKTFRSISDKIVCFLNESIPIQE